MNKQYENIIKRRKYCTLLGIVLLLIPVFFYFRGIKLEYGKEEIVPIKGVVYIEDMDDILSDIHAINGEWISYDGLYLDNESWNDEYELEYRQLPEVKLNEVKSARTYEVRIEGTFTEESLEELMLYIPYPYTDTKVMVNGNEMKFSENSGRSFNNEGLDRLYFIGEGFDRGREYQSIMVSVNQDGKDYGLFRREITISGQETIRQYVQVTGTIEHILFGMLVVSLLLGLVYMLILPSHTMLSSMTMFDTSLMLYVFFNISSIPTVLFNGLFEGLYGEPIIRGITLAMFCWMGYWANRISLELFDEKEELNPKYSKAIARIWIIGMVINGILPQYYNEVAIAMTLIVYCMTFGAASIRIQICRRNGNYGRNLMIHAAKATYVGVLLGYDVITFNTSPRNNVILLLGYAAFFLIEFLMRATVYKEAFDKIREDRAQLEDMVKARTQELEVANVELRGLMGVDGLTKAKNRLYFEETLDKMFESGEKTFSMCIFDLDKFKNINDRYGHAEGDEQLKEVVMVANTYIDDSCILARIGGEEFAILFTNHIKEEVIEITENIRMALEKNAGNNEMRTTGSFGIAKVRDGDTKKSFFTRADECQYKSKNNGRNCITYEFEEKRF